MNEEEKEAIEFLKHSIFEYEEIDTSVMEYIDKNHKIIYKLILKQQKEIEKLKKKMERYEDERNNTILMVTPYFKDTYIRKDKIKEILEELDSYNFKGNFDDVDFIQSIIQQFKELLGE